MKKIVFILIPALLGIFWPAGMARGYSFEPNDYYSETRSSTDDGYTVTRTRVVEREISNPDEGYGQPEPPPDSDLATPDTDQSEQPDDTSNTDFNYQPQSPPAQNIQPYVDQEDTGYSYAPAPPTTYSYGYSPYYVAPAYPYYYDYYPSFSVGLGWGYWNRYPYYHHYRPYWHDGHHRVYGNYPHGGYHGDRGYPSHGRNWSQGHGSRPEPRNYQAGPAGRSSHGGNAFRNSQPSGGRSFNNSPRFQSGGSAPRQSFGRTGGGPRAGGGGGRGHR